MYKMSSFINCEVEFSATISLKPACVFRHRSKCPNMIIISIWCVRRAFKHVITEKRARFNNSHIWNSRFVTMRWNSICWDCGETMTENVFSRNKNHYAEPKSTHKSVKYSSLFYKKFLSSQWYRLYYLRECQFMLIILLFFAGESAKINFVN